MNPGFNSPCEPPKMPKCAERRKYIAAAKSRVGSFRDTQNKQLDNPKASVEDQKLPEQLNSAMKETSQSSERNRTAAARSSERNTTSASDAKYAAAKQSSEEILLTICSSLPSLLHKPAKSEHQMHFSGSCTALNSSCQQAALGKEEKTQELKNEIRALKEENLKIQENFQKLEQNNQARKLLEKSLSKRSVNMLQEKNMQIEELHTKVNREKKEVGDILKKCNEEIEELKLNLSARNQDLENKEAALKDLQKQIQQSTTVKVNSKPNTSNKVDILAELRKSKENNCLLKEKLIEAERKTAKLQEEYDKNMQTSQSHLQEIVQQYKLQSKENEKLSAQCRDYESTVIRLKGVNRLDKHGKSQFIKTNEKLQFKLNANEKRREELLDTLKQMVEKHDAELQEVTILKDTTIVELRKELRERARELENVLNEGNELTAEKKELLDGLANTIDELHFEKECAINEVQVQEKELVQVKLALNEAQNENSQLESKVRKMEMQNQAQEEQNKTKMQTLQAALNHLEKKNKTLQMAWDESQKNKHHLTQQLSDMQLQNGKFETQVESMQIQYEQHILQVEEALKAERENSQELAAKLQLLQQDKQMLIQNLNRDMDTKLAQLYAQLYNYDAEVNTLRTIKAELTGYLNSLKIQLNNAFHQKVADNNLLQLHQCTICTLKANEYQRSCQCEALQNNVQIHANKIEELKHALSMSQNEVITLQDELANMKHTNEELKRATLYRADPNNNEDCIKKIGDLKNYIKKIGHQMK